MKGKYLANPANFLDNCVPNDISSVRDLHSCPYTFSNLDNNKPFRYRNVFERQIFIDQ